MRRQGDPARVTAVLVDHRERVDSGSTEQRHIVQPAVLRSAGWRVEQVLAPSGPSDVGERLVAAASR